MNRIGLGLLTLSLLGACQSDNENLNRKLDVIAQRLTTIESKLGAAPASGAAAARPPQPQRAKPDPTAVYAVPIGESASIGSKLAKVTIVEAFTFT